MAERIPKVGDFYCHFKNKLYQIKDIAIHSETRESYVVYQALYGDYQVYIRPLDMFVSEVDHVKYPEVKQRYRFTKVLLDHEGNKSYPEEESGFAGPDAKDAVASKPGTSQVEQPARRPHLVWEKPVEGEVHPGLLAFLDTDDFEEKHNILVSLRDVIDHQMIDAMAASLDAVIPEGEVVKRYDDLKNIVRTRQKYEHASRF